jgi:hypothetical protein
MPPYDNNQATKDLDYVCKKLSITKQDFLNLMSQPNKSSRDYKNQALLISLGVKLAQILGIENRQYR